MKISEKSPFFSDGIGYGSFRENTVEKAKKKISDSKSGIKGLFRYARKGDLLLMAIGSVFAVVHGASMPALALIFGQMTNAFIFQSFLSDSSGSRRNESDAETFSFLNETFGSSDSTLSAYMTRFALYYSFIGAGVFVAAFVQTLCWEMACERQIFRLKGKFFSQLLRQDISWFDLQKGGDLTTKLSDDLERVREGSGAKMSMVLQYVSTFFSGLGVGLYSNFKLTLIVLGVSPVLIGTSAYMAKVASSSAAREQLKYSVAGKIAEEALTAIRTVVAYGGQHGELKRYEAGLKEGFVLAMKKYHVLSAGIAGVFFSVYAGYGLAFWCGSEMIRFGTASPGSVFTVFFSAMAGAFALGNALPFVNAVGAAAGAAGTIIDVIDRIPQVDPYSVRGSTPKKIEGRIRFENVKFSYPARRDVPVLINFSLEVKPGTTVALVGPSGAGKSTVASLLLRHYDPSEGKVTLDGIDLRDLNLDWFRSQIGLVSQEPVLFGVSVEENIRYGRSDVTSEEIISAAKMANAHDFISCLPKGYETSVGEQGWQLSGGQKQRIAIARALVRDPKILVLDEATSALDSRSEGEVQEALNVAAASRTTLIVAHRLSTVKNADVIYVLKNGEICEKGSHEKLMSEKGVYSRLVADQSRGSKLAKGNSDGEKKDSVGENALEFGSCVKFEAVARTDFGKDEEIPKVSMRKLLALNGPEWPWLLLGLFGCVLTGSVMPIFAYFYGEIFSTFQLSGEELRRAASFWAWMFVALAVVSGFAYWLQTLTMVTAAEKLVLRLRLLAFGSVVNQPVSRFDSEEYSSGVLVTRLARDAPLIKAAAGLRAGQLISAGVTLAAAVTLAFLSGWKLALVLLAASPAVAFASHRQMALLRKNQRRDALLADAAGRVASEAVRNIRTVRSLGLEKLLISRYLKFLAEPFREAKKQASIFALVFAFSQSVIFLMYSGAFRFGAYLVETGEMTASQVYRVFFALAFCAASVGQASAYLQDYSKAKMAAEMLFRLVYAKTEPETESYFGIKPPLEGKIRFEGVHFRYPSRPDVPVLKGADLEVEPGTTLALVGPSGAGKTTFISLLERFYDPNRGQVCIDDKDIKTFDVKYLRSCMGLVSQEPILFDRTIYENIAYGTENATVAEVIEASKKANIHQFIAGLPRGYDTPVGERGGQLSGGQKQRIAIARALVRNPKILLLDEATSALDGESERVVREALEKARKGRTCIIIAHRLSTIEIADSVAVLNEGVVVQKGTHSRLSEEPGLYRELIERQKM